MVATKLGADLGPLADEHQNFHIAQSGGELIHVLDMIIPYLGLVFGQLFEAFKRVRGVELIVQNGDFHDLSTRKIPIH